MAPNPPNASRGPADPARRVARGGDVLSGPADDTRPANPWPRLLAFGAVVAAVVVLAGLCVVSFADTPDREIQVRTTEFEPGLPKFLAVQAFGHDPQFRTYGAFLAVPADGPARALFSRDPDSGCNLQWEALTVFEGTQGVFVDPCSDARYAFDGTALHAGATRDLHRFDVTRITTGYVVTFEEMTLGTCRQGATEGCSPPGGEERRSVPKRELPDDFGNR